MNLPKCDCGTVLEMNIGYTGADWDSKAGDGSGYGWEVELVCPSCGRCYVVGYLKHEYDISPPVKQ